ncbi:MAG TPA: hypothetical protein VIV14_00980, partial [Gammaproteobacteria bacterium]
SPEPPHHLRIQNVPAVVVGGQHPQTGEWIEEVTVPEDLAYDRLKELFVISDTMVGWQTYDVLSFQLYGWLISEGHYGGTIV